MSRTLYDCPRIGNRITAALFASQSLSRAGFIAMGTVGALVAMELSGGPTWAGTPAAVLQFGAAFAALAVAATTERFGRRLGLALGLGVGVFGSVIAAGAIVAHTLVLFLIGSAIMGVASASAQLGRFAAAEVHPPHRRGRAISRVVIGGAVGSVLGPLLVGPSGRWAATAGLNELVGPYLVAPLIFALSALVMLLWLNPDPRDVGRKMAAKHPEPKAYQGPTRSITTILRTPSALVAISAMALSQIVMVMIMVVTSLHMKDNQHTLGGISLVISAHALGMFAFAILSGRLADRWGRGPLILAGAGVLLLGSVLAPLSPDLLPLSFALFLVGLGWNFCFVGGSALLTDQLLASERAKTQGTNDLLIGVATATASLLSGAIFAGIGYAGMGTLGAAVSVGLAGITGWWLASQRSAAAIPQSPTPTSPAQHSPRSLQ